LGGTTGFTFAGSVVLFVGVVEFVVVFDLGFVVVFDVLLVMLGIVVAGGATIELFKLKLVLSSMIYA
jgi:hypothetical protein